MRRRAAKTPKLCGKPERHSNGRFTWALRGKEDPDFKPRARKGRGPQ